MDQLKRTIHRLVSIAMLHGALIMAGFGQAPETNETLATFGQRAILQGTSWGFSLLDCQSEQVVVAAHADRKLIPGSTQKLFVSGTVLAEMEATHAFTTSCYLQPAIVQGDTLVGDVVIVAGGDPAFGSKRQEGAEKPEQLLTSWAQGIWQRGIRHIRGSVVVLDPYFQDPLPPGSWAWEDLGNYYAPVVAGITWRDNRYELTFKTGSPNTPAVLIDSDPDWVKDGHVNLVMSGPSGSGDEAYIHGVPLSTTRFVRGTLPPYRSSFTIKGALPDPGYALAFDFTEVVERHGVKVAGKPTAYYGHQAEAYRPVREEGLIGRHQSPQIIALLKHMNFRSENLYAEILLKQLGKITGNATTNGGIDVLAQYAKDLGLSTDDMIWQDGSGLSRQNLVTPLFQASYLAKVHKADHFEALLNTLPEAGKDGTLRYLDLGSIPGRLLAKSGTLNGVRAYAGYYQSQSGKWYAFSFIVNNFSGPSATMRQAMQPVFQSFGRLP